MSRKMLMAPRLDTLEGKRLGVIWNGRTHGDKVLQAILENLGQRFSFRVIDFLKKPFVGNVAPKDYFDRLVDDRVDGAIVGVGD
ncbi:hypothetical protein ACFLWX_00135 [Chloroflexota bacterium]